MHKEGMQSTEHERLVYMSTIIFAKNETRC
jgi:hypothetical protein